MALLPSLLAPGISIRLMIRKDLNRTLLLTVWVLQILEARLGKEGFSLYVPWLVETEHVAPRCAAELRYPYGKRLFVCVLLRALGIDE